MKRYWYALSLLCSIPLLQSCSYNTPPAEAWSVSPLMRTRDSVETAATAYQLGRYYQAQHRLDQAIPFFLKAIVLDPKYAEAYNALGACYTMQGKLEQAVSQFRTAITLSPNSGHIHNNLGYVYYLQHDDQRAVNQLQEALRLNPGDKNAAENLQRALRQSSLPAYASAPMVEEGAQASALIVPPALQTRLGGGRVQPVVGAVPLTPYPPVNRPPNTPPQSSNKNLPPDRHAAVLPTRQSYLLEIANGNGVPGMARKYAQQLQGFGSGKPRLSNQKPFRQRLTRIQYRAGFEEEARRLGSRLSLPPKIQLQHSVPGGSDIRLVLGKDLAPSTVAGTIPPVALR